MKSNRIDAHVFFQPSRVRHRAAFSLVELLVVIAMIALLVTLLLPSLNAGIERAKEATCKANMRQLGAAILSYASDHEGYFPFVGKNSGAYQYVSWDDLLSGYDGRPALDPESSSPENGMKARALLLDRHGRQAMYRCPSHENEAGLMQGGERALPRSYGINWYEPDHSVGPNYAIGVSGTEKSRAIGQIRRPSRSIVLYENVRNSKLGSLDGVRAQGAGYRNLHVKGAPWNTSKGPHDRGRISNFLMADGSVIALDFVTTGTREDGTFMFAGPDWRDTMWDCGP